MYELREQKNFLGHKETVTDSLKWGKNIVLMCDHDELYPYAVKCLEYLDNLPKEVEEKLAKGIFAYYKRWCKFFDEDEIKEWGEITLDNVFEHIYLHVVIVEDDCRQDIIEFHTECECDWEIEHGLEFTISDHKVLYVGGFENVCPNDDIDQDDEYNFALERE